MLQALKLTIRTHRLLLGKVPNSCALPWQGSVTQVFQKAFQLLCGDGMRLELKCDEPGIPRLGQISSCMSQYHNGGV